MKWSISSHNCFERCQRQYFFSQIMAYHNAKKDPERREAYLLKQLSSLSAWRGKLVHLALEKYFVPSLQNKALITCEELTQKTNAIAHRQLEFSRQRKYRREGTTKSKAGDAFLALKVHESDVDRDEEHIELVFAEIEQCYKNLYNNHKLIHFLTERADWYQTEFRLSFKFNNVTIVGQPDLLVGYGSKKICIIDWKTGRSKTDYSKQLYLYGLSVFKSKNWFNYRLESLLLVEVNLLQNTLVKRTIDESIQLQMENFIASSIARLETVTGDRKYDLNLLKNYAYTDNPAFCKYCNFQQICRDLP